MSECRRLPDWVVIGLVMAGSCGIVWMVMSIMGVVFFRDIWAVERILLSIFRFG